MRTVITLTLLIVALTETTSWAGDEGIRESIVIPGSGIRFCIRGHNQDIVSVSRNGRELFRERLYGIAKDPGRLGKSEVRWIKTSTGANLAFRWGRNDDLMYAIAVQGDRVTATRGEYWRHPRQDLCITFEKAGLVAFSSGCVDRYVELKGDRWILR